LLRALHTVLSTCAIAHYGRQYWLML
jgi:hypothetical protein